MRPHTPKRIFITAACILLAGVAAKAQQTETPPPQVTLKEISITPSAPGADTLCKLAVTVENQGPEVASQLDFKVKINGRELPVYRNQLFMYPVPPGKTADIQLYNFWSTETSRPMPENGKLSVEVTLAAAQWMRITMEDEVEVWQPLGEVAGLPDSESVTLDMQR